MDDTCTYVYVHVYCKPRKENVPLIITNVAWVGANVLSSAHARIYTSPLQKNVPSSLVGCTLEVSEAPMHAERRSSTKAANKEVACELKRCDKRKRARSEYHHYTVLYKALTLMDVKLPAITKTLNILVANISGFTVLNVWATNRYLVHNKSKG